jgi:hypothetical protein
MMSLEDQLATGMREATTGLVPPPDLIDRAARANRRRRNRFAVVASGLSVVAVLAVVYAIAATPKAAPQQPATSPSASPQLLSPMDIAQQAIAVLNGDAVEHVQIVGSFSKSHDQSWTEIWSDPAANNTWIAEPVPHKITAPVGDTVPWMPANLRQKLGGDLRPMGTEQINGRPAVRFHLPAKDAEEDLWVDTATYQVVRLRIVLADSRSSLGDHITTMDFAWFTRTPGAMPSFSFTPPPTTRK